MSEELRALAARVEENRKDRKEGKEGEPSNGDETMSATARTLRRLGHLLALVLLPLAVLPSWGQRDARVPDPECTTIVIALDTMLCGMGA